LASKGSLLVCNWLRKTNKPSGTSSRDKKIELRLEGPSKPLMSHFFFFRAYFSILEAFEA